jgi:tetratricopeptide (TPR) repeat protein
MRPAGLATGTVFMLLGATWAAAQTSAEKIDQAVKLLDDDQRAPAVRLLREALAELETAVAKDRKAADLHYQIGRANHYLFDYRKALDALGRAVGLEPKKVEYRHMKGLAHAAVNEHENAAVELSAAVELAPKNYEYRFDLGESLVKSGKVDEGVKALRAAAGLHPEAARGYGIAGTILAEAGKDAAGVEMFAEAVRLDPKYLLAHYNIGQLNQNLGRNEAALAGFTAAAALRPEDWRIRAKLVQTHQALGNAKDRDRQRAAVFDLHKKGRVEAEFYCREQFAAGGMRVMVFEYFELKGELAVRYSFQVIDPKTDKAAYRISLGSYEKTTQIGRETGAIPKDGRMFHLDRYGPGPVHATLGMYRSEPSYEETRKSVTAAIEGKLKPLSSSEPK